MIGIIVQLAISWLLVWLVEKKDLSVLGLLPTKRRLIDFILFFFITALCCSLEFLMRILIGKEQWGINPVLSASLVLKGTWWNLKSVLFEELIFRGVLLYILIKKLGTVKAIFISSIAFGIYHWFSHNLFGNPQQMIITFIITGIMGLLLAYGYAKTFSLYIPVAIHLGWNLTKGFIFSDGPIGNGIFVLKHQPHITVSWFLFFVIVFMPVISMWIINYLILKKKKQQSYATT